MVIVTASYNGRPPDNAVQFNNWLESGLAEAGVAIGGQARFSEDIFRRIKAAFGP